VERACEDARPGPTQVVIRCLPARARTYDLKSAAAAGPHQFIIAG